MTFVLDAIWHGDDEEELLEECECGECGIDDFGTGPCSRARLEHILNGVRQSTESVTESGIAWNLETPLWMKHFSN